MGNCGVGDRLARAYDDVYCRAGRRLSLTMGSTLASSIVHDSHIANFAFRIFRISTCMGVYLTRARADEVSHVAGRRQQVPLSGLQSR